MSASPEEMNHPPIGSREQWLAARRELLALEKEHTHQRDTLNARRRRLPWYSSCGSDFNYDFFVTTDETKRAVEYNYKDRATLEREQPQAACCHCPDEGVEP